ncbi:MAG: electron transfer flavoprotein subunit alpha/FixB family protein [Desulfobacterales bacterium]|nr:electron transfer flavoprotein subunit alpha/FixB family protein [Desulfobacterales bacterium]
MKTRIGLLIELENGRVKPANMEMIAMAQSDTAECHAIVVDDGIEQIKSHLESYGVERIIHIDLASGKQKNPVLLADVMTRVIKKFRFEYLFGLSTAWGKDILPRIAADMEAPLIMDCTTVDTRDSTAVTSQYSGKTMATFRVKGPVKVFGIRPNMRDSIKRQVSAQVDVWNEPVQESQIFTVISTGESEKESAQSLVEADVILAGGRGMKQPENFSILKECAGYLNAAVGSSRVPVDSGWVPYAMQVGQTGEKVSPRVYIACGISGSVQHFAGMKSAGMIIAVNPDENAPIMANCDYFVKADAIEIIPEITRILKDGTPPGK